MMVPDRSASGAPARCTVRLDFRWSRRSGFVGRNNHHRPVWNPFQKKGRTTPFNQPPTSQPPNLPLDSNPRQTLARWRARFQRGGGLTVLSFQERMFVKAMFRETMADLYEQAFEDFFHRLMTARYPDFVPVRTHGNLGDLSADGLRLHDGRLYACYAPRVFDANKIREKFSGDLSGAISKRSGDFRSFVFVYNDTRGLHPEVSRLLAQAKIKYPQLGFETMAPPSLLREIFHLDRQEIEDLFGAPIPVQKVVYGIGLEELRPLLEHLMTHRRRPNGQVTLREVSGLKLEYNQLSEDDREMLRLGMRYTHLVDEYYHGISEITERDEVAADFNAYYLQIAEEHDDPERVVMELQKYVAGNQRATSGMELALWVILTYFFETCDIFREPPPGWRRVTTKAALP